MGGVADAVGGVFGGGADAAGASQQATAEQLAYQQEALDYLKAEDKLPKGLRESALRQLGGLYGLEGGEGSQTEFIERAKQSPLYGAIMGGQEAGEEAILRNASATGGLRSGNVQENLYDYNTQLQNNALLQSYNSQLQGLGGMSSLQSYAPQIAGIQQTMGQTQAQGTLGAAQGQQAGNQQGLNNLMGLGSLGMSLFSDSRLKKNKKPIGKKHGFNWYSWDWNDLAKTLGLSGSAEGVMAEDVLAVKPDAVSVKDGYLQVNYGSL